MTELVCPECQHKNEEAATYCEECGIMMKTAAAEDVVPGGIVSFKPGDLINDRYKVVTVSNRSTYDSSYIARDLESEGKAVWIKQKKEGKESGIEYEKQKPVLEILKNSSHRNVARLLDHFKIGESVFTIFEKYSGGDALSLMKFNSGKLSQEFILDLAIQAVEGMKFLHSLNILHMDLQLSHLFLIDNSTLKITGFSRACSMESPVIDNAVTEGFSPPEAFGLMGGKIGKHSDIYSLGATLYSLIAGRIPELSRENFFTFTSLSDTGQEIDREFENIILKAAKKEPSERFKSFDEMLTALIDLKDRGLSPKSEDTISLDLEISGRSHIGKVRKTNQDAFLVLRLNSMEKSRSNKYDLMIVADGMGGEAEGDKASSLAVKVIAREVLSSILSVNVGTETAKLYPSEIQERSAEILKDALLKANKVVYEYSRGDPSRRGMGCTISGALISQNNLCICHAGDTRAYIFNKDEGLAQLTEDHSLVGRLVRLGQLTREEAQKSPQRSAVYRALGTTPDLDIDVYQHTLKLGDYLIMCSDGVWEYYPDREISSIIIEEGQSVRIIDRLIRTCLERGADDNATVIVVHSKIREDLKTEHLVALEPDEKREVTLGQVARKRYRQEREKKRSREEAKKKEEKESKKDQK